MHAEVTKHYGKDKSIHEVMMKKTIVKGECCTIRYFGKETTFT